MAATRAPQGVNLVPADSATGRLWAGGRTRRIITEQYGFVASTTTPFSTNTPAGVIVYDSALSYESTATATGVGELDMDSPTGMEFVISNYGSGQTLSGVTLTDYDTLPSGVSVPGQSYTTATNVATGASVTLSSLSLASGSAIRVWLAVSNSASRMWVMNPTYAAAVTIGTGSFEVRATPTYGQVALTGSLPAGTNDIGSVVLTGNLPTGTLVTSQTATGSFATAIQTAPANAKGLMLVIDVTAVSGTSPTLALQLITTTASSSQLGVSPASTNITAIGHFTYILYPAALSTAIPNNVGTEDVPLPPDWGVYFDIGGTTPSFTFAVDFEYLP